jgi:hypothetical protein
MKQYIAENRAGDAPFDIVIEGQTPGGDPERAAEIVRPFAESGATWWIEAPWTGPNQLDDLRRRINQGPPRVLIRGNQAAGPPPNPAPSARSEKFFRFHLLLMFRQPGVGTRQHKYGGGDSRCPANQTGKRSSPEESQ